MHRWVVTVLLLGVAVPPASAFRRQIANDGLGTGLAWFDRHITWYLEEPGSADVPYQAAVAAAKRAFGRWAAVGCTDINFTYAVGTVGASNLDGDEADGRNTIRWRERDWPGAPDQIAITSVVFDRGTGRIIDVDIDLNGEYLYYTAADDPVKTEYDIESALVHEVGHLLGFDDSDDPGSAMGRVLERGDLARVLGDDDLRALCSVYPVGEPTPHLGAVELDMYGGCTVSARAPRGTTFELVLLLLLAAGGWAARRTSRS